MLKNLIWFFKSDIQLKTDTCWYGKDEKIEGFYFYSKRPFSKSYQYHSVIGLNYTYDLLFLIQDAIKNKRKAVLIEVSSGYGIEKVYMYKSSLKKAEKQMLKLIKEIQEQY
ncbi:hypothetical protein [Metabacillus arenae]|uniref:Uncharacterized protein n=1 Tax=Metabacillus arenae TaxID=2771434 RepID=A0A926RW16_9BACI|nr:hypothetical protein [Metabacillus arenae]MBD1379085.1 hypothetical protein [Metabacillus arenae]